MFQASQRKSLHSNLEISHWFQMLTCLNKEVKVKAIFQNGYSVYGAKPVLRVGWKTRLLLLLPVLLLGQLCWSALCFPSSCGCLAHPGPPRVPSGDTAAVVLWIEGQSTVATAEVRNNMGVFLGRHLCFPLKGHVGVSSCLLGQWFVWNPGFTMYNLLGGL